MPLIDLECQDCKHVFEDFTNFYNPPRMDCPKCGGKKLEKLITFTKARGTVELTGHELRAKVLEDAQKLKKEVHSNEKAYANVLGEAKYQQLQQRLDKGKRERGRR